MDIDIKGDIIDDDSAWIYDWIGWSYTSPKNVINSIKEANGEPLNIKINSLGGSVFSASEIYTELRAYKGEVNITITGIAASAASVIAMAGKNKMSPTAQLMVHNVSSCAQGDYRDMDHMSEILRNANTTIANAYVAKSGMSMEDALKLMDNETYLNAQRAKELGLIDEILFDDSKDKLDFKGMSNKLKNGFYNSYSSIPTELLERLKNISGQQNVDNDDLAAIFMQQKAKSKQNLLKLKECVK